MEDNTVLLVPKSGPEMFIFGKEETNLSDEKAIKLSEVVLIQLMPTPQGGIAPVSGHYPNPFVKEFVSESHLNKQVISFNRNDYMVYAYDVIKPQALDMYQRSMTERSGIILATSMPKMNG